MSDRHERVQRAIELCVLAPIGIAVTVKDLAPNFVNVFVARGRRELGRRQGQVGEHLRTARGAGEVALAFGVPMVVDKVTGRVAETREPSVTAEASSADDAEAIAPTPKVVANEVGVAPVRGSNSNGATHLAIPGYDTLSASQIVERLAGLDHIELAAVGRYESEHRSRRTILGKIDQLRVD